MSELFFVFAHRVTLFLALRKVVFRVGFLDFRFLNDVLKFLINLLIEHRVILLDLLRPLLPCLVYWFATGTVLAHELLFSIGTQIVVCHSNALKLFFMLLHLLQPLLLLCLQDSVPGTHGLGLEIWL